MAWNSWGLFLAWEVRWVTVLPFFGKGSQCGKRTGYSAEHGEKEQPLKDQSSLQGTFRLWFYKPHGVHPLWAQTEGKHILQPGRTGIERTVLPQNDELFLSLHPRWCRALHSSTLSRGGWYHWKLVVAVLWADEVPGSKILKNQERRTSNRKINFLASSGCHDLYWWVQMGSSLMEMLITETMCFLWRTMMTPTEG